MTTEEQIAAMLRLISQRYDEREYPSLRNQAERFRRERPFGNRVVLDCTPLYANTLVKFIPLLAGGANLIVGASERIPHDRKIVEILSDIGIPCVSEPAQVPAQPDVILDCDGSMSGLKPKLGVCELTRSGLYHYQDSDLPVILVDSSVIKEIETTIGTGDGYMRAMRQLGYTDWADRKVIVFGFGKVGRGVALRCIKAGAKVTAVDRIDLCIAHGHPQLEGAIDLHDTDRIRKAVEDCDFLITATGVRGAMVRHDLGEIIRRRNDIVVSAIGIEDEWLDSLERERIVNDGRAVNFLLDEPTLLRYIDPTMALSNQSAADLVNGRITAAGVSSPDLQSEKLCLDPVIACGLIADELRDMKLVRGITPD